MPTYLSDVLIVLDEGADPAAVEHRVAELGEEMPYAVELTTPMNMRISEGIGGTPADIQVELFAADLAPVAARQAEVQRLLAALPGVESVSLDTGAPLPSWRIVPDDAALRRLDVPRRALLETASAALQGLPLAPLFDGPQRIERVVRFPTDGRITAETLRRLPIVVEEGRIVELGQVARVEETTTPSMLKRKNGQRRLGFNVRTTGDLGGTARRIERALAAVDLPGGELRPLGPGRRGAGDPASPGDGERARARPGRAAALPRARPVARGGRGPRDPADRSRRRRPGARPRRARPGTRARSSASSVSSASRCRTAWC